ncbi:malic enzyme protein [Corynebacterium lubricantis]|uniref:malic enzyme protein n=1 Tax=Corynebacterium lubricantis TaxID=541095 RepID=UPI0006846A7D
MSAPASQGAHRREELPTQRIQNSYTCRFLTPSLTDPDNDFHLIAGSDVAPRAGDVVLARVVGIHNHKRVETEHSRKAILFEGHLVLLAYGHRYAADQFLAHIPDSLDYCHLVAAGGIAGVVTEQHAGIDEPTLIEPLGLLARDGVVVNVMEYAPHVNVSRPEAPRKTTEVIAVLGTSMNSGKSTTAACMINGFTKAGKRVGAGKITGTGAGNDRNLFIDAGAADVVDFTDFGYGTTFRLDFNQVRDLTANMIELLSHNNDVVIVEIADGIYQDETVRLLRDDIFQASVDRLVFSAVDALGARAGVQTLQEAGLSVACASGVMTSSPLAAREAAAVLLDLDVPVINTFELCEPQVVEAFISQGQ